jgi:hypothetical protein
VIAPTGRGSALNTKRPAGDIGGELIERFKTLQREAPDVDVYAHMRKATDDVIAELKRDAARWRALLASERIRLIGTGRLGTREGHIALEAWGRYSGGVNPEHQAEAREALSEFADGLRNG